MSNLPPLPFSRSYWVIPGRLLAGFYPGSPDPYEADQKIRAMLNCGIRRVINLMETTETNSTGLSFVPYIERMRELAGPGQAVAFTRYPIRDGGLPQPEMMRVILDEIDASLAAEQPVYVHCWGGKGRTGTVVGCYLMRHHLAKPETVLDEITHLRRDVRPVSESPETQAQRNFVCAWNPGE